MKKLLSILCTFACIFSLTVFGNSTVMAAESTSTYGGVEANQFEAYVQSLYTTLATLTDQDIDKFIANGDQMTVDTMESWKAVKDKLGEFVDYGEFNIKEDAGIITAELVVDYSQSDLLITAVLDASTLEVASIIASLAGESTTGAGLGATMAKAGLNTLMGMGTVFVILILISLIISSFGLIDKAQKSKKQQEKKPELAETAATNAVAQIEKAEDLTDDLELVAVISAAIAASEGTTTDGFVVRSIRKRR